MKKDDWICCKNGEGYQHESGAVSSRLRHFPKNSVGLIKAIKDDVATVWLIGTDETWDVKAKELSLVDVAKTGDKHKKKICNMCHKLLNVEQFSLNQNNKHGVIRRPSCKQCRTDIDKRAPKSKQAKAFEKKRPKKGQAFKCPICQKRSIANVTAKIVADHNHHTGNIRDFICDSCNTGLGRFKNGEDYLKNAIRYLEERDGSK